MKIKCIIIDDEPLAAEVVETHLKEFSNIELLGSFTNPLDALQIIENGEVDAVFIDINMLFVVANANFTCICFQIFLIAQLISTLEWGA